MFNQSRDPRLTFIDDDRKEVSFTLDQVEGTIKTRSAVLQQRVAPGSSIGLLLRTGPDLIIDWLACLVAGLRPLIIQYPTNKLSHKYWFESVHNTVQIAGLVAVIADERACSLGVEGLLPTIRATDLTSLPVIDGAPVQLGDFEILQLSSGTTGHRKAMSFRSADLRRHVEDYNRVLGLGPSDRIISWLPLYHDMGYIACFVMPLMLGIDVVMMDPMTWTQDPELLFDAIERHNGTVCYMPNFGFEVMSRREPRLLGTMRWWVSCSEPVSAKTSRRFLDTVGSPKHTFAPCYAMAENIFAVAIRRGIRTATLDGAEFTSCGPTIPGVEIKTVDNQMWVRSPTSLNRYYLAEESICDAEGFYPTGDLGEIIDGELYVTGRKQDLMIQAGRKIMLSEFDLKLNELFPDVRGRGVTVALRDEALGTESPHILIERTDFFSRKDQAEIVREVSTETGLDQIHVDFVPPRFLTKTSSGKFNRKKSAADWLTIRQPMNGAKATSDLASEIAATFSSADRDRPVSEALDSLSLTLLRMMLTDRGIRFDQTKSLAAISTEAPRNGVKEHVDECIRIVCIGDGPRFRRVTERHLDRLGARLGSRVTFEHYAVPPSPILLSDIIFHDYFQKRIERQTPFASLNRVLEAIKGASVIIADDHCELFLPSESIYGVLSHSLERDPRTDLISVRWQRYAQQHHLLPTTLVNGADLPLTQATAHLARLREYLSTPIFRVSYYRELSDFTSTWDHHSWDNHGIFDPLEPNAFMESLGCWLEHQDIRPVPRSNRPAIDLTDAPHYCSHAVKKDVLDTLVRSFSSICIAGLPSSLPYLRQRIEQAGKDYVLVPSYAREVLDRLGRPYDCLAICGAWGHYDGDWPVIALQHVGNCRMSPTLPSDLVGVFQHENIQERPPSNRDWFYPDGLVGQDNRRILAAHMAIARTWAGRRPHAELTATFPLDKSLVPGRPVAGLKENPENGGASTAGILDEELDMLARGGRALWRMENPKAKSTVDERKARWVKERSEYLKRAHLLFRHLEAEGVSRSAEEMPRS